MKKVEICLVIFFVTFFLTKNVFAKIDYFLQGEELFNKKKFSESKFKFEKDIVFNPKSEKSYLYLAKIFKKEENDELQEKNLNTVILLNPKNEEAIFLLTLLKIKILKNQSFFLKKILYLILKVKNHIYTWLKFLKRIKMTNN